MKRVSVSSIKQYSSHRLFVVMVVAQVLAIIGLSACGISQVQPEVHLSTSTPVAGSSSQSQTQSQSAESTSETAPVDDEPSDTPSYRISTCGSKNGVLQRIVINNFTTIVENLSKSEREIIEQNLCWTIGLNTTVDVTEITDANIRESSYHQTYNSNKKVYTTTFLVDIPSLRQTYAVSDKWSPVPAGQSDLSDYSAMVLCPSEEDLVFGPFPTCLDVVKWQDDPYQ